MADCAPPDLLPLFLAEMAALDERPKAEARARPYRPANMPTGGINRPGDDYNGRTNPVEYLTGMDWKIDHVQGEKTYLTRPGKGGGVSASVNHCKTAAGLPRVYVFTSNAAPLEPDTSYDAAGLFAAKECGGDWDKAVRRLADMGYGEESEPIRWKGGQKRGPAPAPTVGAASAGWVSFRTDKLPEPLQSFVRENAGAIGCDEAAVAVPLLATFAGIIGNRRRLKAKPGFTQPACLWAAVVGLTGTMKSPAWGAADWVANKVDRELEECSALAAEQWKAKADDGDSSGRKPRAEKLIVEDITIETVASTLADNPNGLLVSMDELSVWFDLFTRYRKGGGSDVTRWLGMWEGRRLKVARKVSGELYIPHALMSVSGTIQPGILARAVSDQERESGFLARLLLCYPPTNQKKWTTRQPDPEVGEKIVALAKKLNALNRRDDGTYGEAVDIEFTPAALEAYATHYNELGAEEMAQMGRDEDRRAAIAKGPRLIMRLALIHHCVTRCAGGDRADAPQRVEADSVEFGKLMSDWFLNELRRVYAIMADVRRDRLTIAVIEWGQARGGRFRVRDLMRARKDRFVDADEARAFLDKLAEAGIGTWTDTGKKEFALTDDGKDEQGQD